MTSLPPVIAHRDPSATFVFSRFNFRKENFGARCFSFYFPLFKIV
jgi:hypothetical protein